MDIPPYVLAPGEEVIFELNIENPGRSGNENPVAIAQKLIGAFFPMLKKKAIAVLVVTNMRVFVTSYPNCCGSDEKYFWSFPRKALNGDNSFTYKAGFCRCCDICTITIGLSIGLQTDMSISFETKDVRSIEQAQAVLAKFYQLSQQEL